MPLLLADGNLMRLRVDAEASGQDVRNSFYVVVSDVVGAPTFLQLLVDMRLDFIDVASGVTAFLSDSWVVNNYRVEILDSIGTSPSGKLFFQTSQAPEIFVPNPLDVGLVVGDQLPVFTGGGATMYSSVRHNVSGRLLRTGNRFSPIVEADTDPAFNGNRLTPAFQTAVGLWLAGTKVEQVVVNGGDTFKYKYVVASPIYWNANGFPPATLPEIVTTTVNPFITSQVSRKKRVGGA